MTVHSFHVFDRKGKTLFTKRYLKSSAPEDEEQLSEQRKLIFGMLFSLRELSSSLSPSDGPGDLHLVRTGASTLYNYETVSGLRFVLYTTPETSNALNSSINSGAPTSSSGAGTGGVGGAATGMNLGNNASVTESIRGALQHVYEHLWVTFVVRSPLFRPSEPDIASTNFETSLDNYLKGMPWFR